MTHSRESISLDGKWTLSWSDRDLEYSEALESLRGPDAITATVPGNVELDLVDAGQLNEPFFGMNALNLQKLEGRHWWYSTTFASPNLYGRDAFLRFEGLDCFSDIYLNAIHILTTKNALVEHEVQVDALLATTNELVVHIRPWTEMAADGPIPAGCMAGPHSVASLRVRKPSHCFGWDIMPRIVTAGIWRPCSLELRPKTRFEELYLVTADSSVESARLLFHYRLKHSIAQDNLRIRIEGSCGESTFVDEQPALFFAGHFYLSVPHPKRWWPKNRGRANLYSVIVTLLQDGETVDQRPFRHGIRSVKLIRTSVTDESGNGEFHFEVNGEPIFVMGTNWVPLDAFHSRDASRLPAALGLLDEVGCNLVRCWGGNVYENDAFYDFCDEHGILIWQDFAMACARYPQDDVFAREIATEVRAVVHRLRKHPCVALWAGDNECDELYLWSNLGDPNRNRLTRDVIPNVLADEDPWRPYLPSSPYIDSETYQRGTRFLPEAHLWGPRNSFRSEYYEGSLCHFASEIGYHGSPSVESIRKFISPDKLWPPTNDEWLLHSTSPIPELHLYDYRIALMSTQIEAFLGRVPEGLNEWVEASQFTQAEAYKQFVERFRTGKWRRTGIVWWNLLDGWPQFSDAVVDYYFDRKEAFKYLQRAQSPVLFAVREVRTSLQLIACNDLRSGIECHYRVYVEPSIPIAEGTFFAPGDSSSLVAEWERPEPTPEFVRIEFSTGRGVYKNHLIAGDLPVDLSWYRDCIESFYGS